MGYSSVRSVDAARLLSTIRSARARPASQLSRIAFFAAIFLICAASANAGTFPVFGSQNYTRGTGAPVTVTNNFSVLNPGVQYTVKAFNGGLQDDQSELVSSGFVTINGVQVIGPSNFNQNVVEVDVPVTLQATNTIDVQVRGKPGGVLTVEIVGVDNDPPVISITSPANGATVSASPVTVTGTVSDAVSGVASVACNGAPATVQAGSFSCVVSLTSGANTITVSATDNAGNTSSASESVTFSNAAAPTITSFAPTSGPIGTEITLTGTNFTASGTATPQIALSQQGGGSIGAPIASFTATSISFVIPAGATSGAVTVTAGSQSATSATSLSVVAASSFAVSAGPTSASVQQGTSTAYSVTLSSSNGFSQLASLSVGGVPTGVTAQFSPTQITTGQSSILTVTAPAGQTLGSATLTISAAATVDGIPTTQTTTVSLAVLAASTSLIGRTVESDNNETPIPGITITMLGVDDAGHTTGCSGQTKSDAAGNFAFINLGTSCLGRQLVAYDGNTATDGETYAGVNLAYTMVAGQITGPELVHMPTISDAETIMVKQNASVDQVFSYSTIPGVTVTVYAGTTLTLPSGGQPDPFPMAAVLVPVDRLPDAPSPTAGTLRASIVAFQPANTTSSLPVSVTFPNVVNTAPGVNMELDTLDPIVGELVKYGTGTVSADALEIVPDLDPARPGHRFGISHFDWHGPMAPAPNGNNPGPDPKGPKGGDPVDPASGLFVFSKTDIAIQGALGRVALVRNYRPASGAPGPFGIGTNHNFGYQLDVSPVLRGTGAFVNLVMPDGNQFPFSQQGTNTFVNSTITAFIGAVITSPAAGTYNLRWKDGTVFSFQTSNQGALLAFLNSITDANGNVTTLVRNPSQPVQITQIIDPAGRALNFAYDSFNRIVSITDPIGRTVQYAYNAQGTLATATDPAGNLSTYTYNPQNQMTSVKDGRGVLFLQNTYDANGRVTQQVAGDGGITTFAYTLLNPAVPTSPVQSTTVTDPLGNQTTYRFNPQGYVIAVTDPLGQVRNFTRDPGTNQLLALQGPGQCNACGNPSVGDLSFTYDTAGNLLTETDAAGHSVQFTYDPTFSRLTSYTDEDGNVSLFGYDTRGNRTSFTDARGKGTSFSVDARGLTTQITDPAGIRTQIAYDSSGNVISIQDASGNVRRAAYDAVSRRILQTDSTGNSTALSYDKLDRVVAITDPLGNITKFTYDPMGNLLTATDARGNITTLSYDAETRLQKQTDALGRSMSFAYDKGGDLIQFTNRLGAISKFSYDSLRHLTTETYPDATVTRTYDSVGRLVRVVDSQAGTFTTNYDVVGHVIGNSTPFGTIDFVRDPAGRVTGRTVVGQPQESFAYDANGNLTSVSMGQASLTMAYDARGLRQSITRSNGVNSNFTFDPMGRMLSRIDAKGATILNSQSYTYDGNGRRLNQAATIAQTLTTPAAIGSYDAADQITQFGSQSYTTDANGNVTSMTAAAGVTQFNWDGRGRLQSINTPDGQKISLTYDFDGNLIQKTSSNGSTLDFILDNLTNVALQYDNAGNSFSFMTGNGFDMQFGFLDPGGQAHFALQGNLGNVAASTNSAGTIEGTTFYEPYGQTTTTAASYPLAYQGRFQIIPNLYYYRARYYDPVSGRFISEDPLVRPGYSPYWFNLNDPTNEVDPLGLQTPLQVGVGAAAGAIVGVGGQVFSDLLSGKLSSWEDYTGAAVGGAVTGALVANFVPPSVAGALGAAAGNLTKQTLNHFAKGCDFDGADFLKDTAIGGITGGIVPDVQGLNAGRGSIDSVFNGLNTKLTNGTINQISSSVIGKEVGSQVAVGALGGEIGGAANAAAGTVMPDGCKDKKE